jgi:TfoX/Sxy family transcriptional regulator of competence genes
VSTSAATIAYIEDQLAGLDIRTARMFGQSCIYCDGKVVGFIVDDTLLIKPSAADPALLQGTGPAKAYPGSKNYHGVPGDLLENRQWLHAAIQATADALPEPKPKRAGR